jgi:MFS family permease
MWLTTLGALLFGTLGVLAPLRMDHLGASSVAIGAAFLVSAGCAAASSPIVGRFSDRRGWREPVLLGLCASALWVILLPIPESPALLFLLIVIADPFFGLSYPSAGALISSGAEHVGLAQGYAFALFNIAWASGQVIGEAGSAGLAQATSDAVPYALLCALCAATAMAVHRRGPRAAPASQLS